ncbi:hypothetical protein M406DRAFT_332947 [Cryphonectria parasitica EP155]|uniref:Uncharacterized protein n=1 Tax=Cryphonectria parasitica (strain ATCC 38755 / EP155) TaxID=660469 RepID=A0A9P4XXY5_CRYP1|nr:uncharacterized protein M406DRAFT_332947 [Cryphonectria parasitica EP155]KAF3762570.1 hypothetical protein M406DRAFT_332947 [Cryphonectria parasitica EP155]
MPNKKKAAPKASKVPGKQQNVPSGGATSSKSASAGPKKKQQKKEPNSKPPIPPPPQIQKPRHPPKQTQVKVVKSGSTKAPDKTETTNENKATNKSKARVKINPIPQVVSPVTPGCSKVPRLLEPSQSVRCAENIVLLEMLTPLPGTERQHLEQPPYQLHESTCRRTLTFDQESKLVTTLAFLSGISDDQEHVTADGFEKIFGELRSALPAASERGAATTQEVVFNQIIALHRERILKRLGSRMARFSGGKALKRFIGLHFRDFIETSWQAKARKRNFNMSPVQLEDYKTRSERLLVHLDSFDALETPKHADLKELVRHVATFLRRVPLERLLGRLNDQDMNANAKKRLLSCFAKTARVQESAKFLCKEAMNTQALRHITVEKQEGIISEYSLPPWVQKGISKAQPFTTRVNTTLLGSKVHAEIQILAHYENVGPAIVPARIIASSKKPCYLCDTLIGLHGRFAAPRSHGRLYPKWRLPTITDFLPLQDKLNRHLEQKITATIQRLAQIGKKPTIMLPNESSIFSLNLSASALTTLSNRSCLNLVSQALDEHGPQQSAAQIAENVTDDPAFIIHPNQEIDEMGVQDSGEIWETDETSGSSQMRNDGIPTLAMDRNIVEGGVLDEAKHGDKTIPFSHSKITGAVSSTSLRSSMSAKAASDSEDENDDHHGQGHESRTRIKLHRPPPFEPVMGRKDWFRSAGLDIFIDDSGLPFTPRWLNSKEAAAELRRHSELVDVKSLDTHKDALCSWKDADGKACFAFGNQVVVIDAHKA